MSSNNSFLAVAALAISLSVPTAVAHAQSRDTRLVGVITKVESNQIEVRMDDCQTKSIALTENTKFRPWNQQARGMSWPAKVPNWQPLIHADVQSLRVAKRVHVDFTPEARPTARIIWIVGP